MALFRRILYMGLGAFLALAVVAGGVAVFAQSGDGAGTEAQDDGQEAEQDEGNAEDSLLPEAGMRRFHGHVIAAGSAHKALLAEALGISEEELDAAYEEVRVALIDQALEEGLITEEQAERLQDSERLFHGRRVFRGMDVDGDELLAEALGISVEALQAARTAAHEARLAQLVEEGVITQEQADLMAARAALNGYIDREALAQTLRDTLQNAYEAAIDDALADGAITQEQADNLLENMPSFESFRFGFGGRGHHGRGHGPGWGGSFAPDTEAPAVDTSFDI